MRKFLCNLTKEKESCLFVAAWCSGRNQKWRKGEKKNDRVEGKNGFAPVEEFSEDGVLSMYYQKNMAK